MNNQPEDPIIKEVRDARRKLAEDAEREGKTLAEYLMEAQKRYGDRLVNRAPKRIVRSSTG